MTSVVERGQEVVPVTGSDTARWYQDAILYEIHVRAFRDSDGDGVGDFRGLIERLDYLQGLGVTALWLLPFYPSPLRDDGYDISDYRDVHPSYGTLRDFRQFLREAHRRGIRVVTELVLAHTSDEHPWFQRARQAPAGSVERDFYVWSDTPDRFAEARVIFQDFEVSNWAFDSATHSYYWHRFYSHQPSLNYDNPAVRRAMFDTVDFWLGMGVDGLRLDAVPYLYAREGTTCENLPETLAFLRDLRAHVESRFENRMLLAEANQWPEDAAMYMDDGTSCHMAFHFPLMPRMFMAARQEDRFPIVDILNETPAIHPDCQWALFLRNHDELTLEMVTDEERDYMYRVYAQDAQARVNMGIRRRLAPLLGNDRKLIEMMNGLLLSLPGTPIIYYGDEIGMGDNIYLGDRDAVRTPMQWDGDRNAGFSRANPQRLYLPVVIDPEYHSQAVNVEAQQGNPSSLLWWMKRLIAIRQRYQAFGRGSLEVLRPDNRKVLAFVRRYGEENILVVVNLSRFAQCVELDLGQFRGATPVEVFGNMPFPKVGELPYFVTLGPHGFYWFSLESEPAEPAGRRPLFAVTGEWDALFRGSARRDLEAFLPSYIAERRWFAQKSRAITSVHVIDAVRVPLSGEGRQRQAAYYAIVRVELDSGSPEQYTLPLAFAAGERAEELGRWHPEAIVADLHTSGGPGVLFDALYEPDFVRAVVGLLSHRRSLPGPMGRLVGVPGGAVRAVGEAVAPEVPVVTLAADQSNSSVALGDRIITKFIRRFEEGVHPAVEIGRSLAQHRFSHAPAVAGSIEYRSEGPASEPATVMVAEEFVPNEGDGWSYVVDALTHGLEEVLANPAAEELAVPPPPGLLDPGDHRLEPGHLLVGPHVEWASLLGRRTAELHLALVADTGRHFAPEPLTAVDRRAAYHGARSSARRIFRQLETAVARRPDLGGDGSSAVSEVLARQPEVIARLGSLVSRPIEAQRIRCHGDYHLGQVLWTGKDFEIIDFEGEPARSLGQRRRKRPATIDLAGMVRSVHYASRAAAIRLQRDLPGSVGSVSPTVLEAWLSQWYRWVARIFLGSYLEVAGEAGFLPVDRGALGALLDFALMEKAVYELGYEMNTRPAWLEVPASGILELLAAPA